MLRTVLLLLPAYILFTAPSFAQNTIWYDPITGFTFEEFVSKSDGKTYVYAGHPDEYSIAAYSFVLPDKSTFGPLYKIDGKKIKRLDDVIAALKDKHTSVLVEDYKFPWSPQKNPTYEPSGRTMPLLLPNPPGQRSHAWGECVTGNCSSGFSELKSSDGFVYKGFMDNKNGQLGLFLSPEGKKWKGSFSSNTKDGFVFSLRLPNLDGDTCAVVATASAFTPGKAKVTEFIRKGERFYATAAGPTVEEFGRKRFAELQPSLKTQADMDNTFTGTKTISEKLRLPGWNEIHNARFEQRIEAGKNRGTEEIAFFVLNSSKAEYLLQGTGLFVNNGKISGKNLRLVEAGKTIMSIETMRNDTAVGRVNINNYPFYQKWGMDGTFQYTTDQHGMVIGTYATEFTGVDKKWERFSLVAEQPMLLKDAEFNMDWLVGSYQNKHRKPIPIELPKLPFNNEKEEIQYYIDRATEYDSEPVAQGVVETKVDKGLFTGNSKVFHTELKPGEVLLVKTAYPKHLKVDITKNILDKCNCDEDEIGPIIIESCLMANFSGWGVTQRVNIYKTGDGQVGYRLTKSLKY